MKIIIIVYVHPNTVLNAFSNSLDSFIGLNVTPWCFMVMIRVVLKLCKNSGH